MKDKNGMYGVSVQTSYEINEENPNRAGKYALSFPEPGLLFTTLEEANAAFDEAVESERKMRQDFTVLLNSYGREEKTLRTESGKRHPDAPDPSIFSKASGNE